jgi:hypothetical protein
LEPPQNWHKSQVTEQKMLAQSLQIFGAIPTHFEKTKSLYQQVAISICVSPFCGFFEITYSDGGGHLPIRPNFHKEMVARTARKLLNKKLRELQISSPVSARTLTINFLSEVLSFKSNVFWGQHLKFQLTFAFPKALGKKEMEPSTVWSVSD